MILNNSIPKGLGQRKEVFRGVGTGEAAAAGEGLAAAGDEFVREVGVGGRAEGIGLVGHELGEEFGGIGAGVGDGGDHVGELGAGVGAEGEGVAGEEEGEFGGEGREGGVEGGVAGEVALDLVEFSGGGFDLAEDGGDVVGD